MALAQAFLLLLVLPAVALTAALSAVSEPTLSPPEGEFFVFLRYAPTPSRHVHDTPVPSTGPADLFWSADPTGGPQAALQPALRAAKIVYFATMAESGWDTVEIETYNYSHVFLNGTVTSALPVAVSDAQQAIAAGFGEGLTAQRSARDYFSNLFGNLNFTAPAAVEAFFDSNDAWMHSQVRRSGGGDPYWHNVGLLLSQLDGVLMGLNFDIPHGTPLFSYSMLRLLQTQGDQMDLYNALNITSPSSEMQVEEEDEDDASKPAPPRRRVAQLERIASAGKSRRRRGGSDPASMSSSLLDTHCSCLVALTEDFSDVFFGHATWGMYVMMLRVFKTYRFAFSLAAGAGHGNGVTEVTFSSYPSVLVSIDDYYTTGAGLVVAETSFTTYNTSLYKAVTNRTLLYWIRVVVANRMSASGRDWSRIFGAHNSGTYNAMWMIMDLGRFVPKQDVPEGFLWIAEQFPGLYSRADVTAELLSAGFWGSFNVPFNRTLFSLSGNAEQEPSAGPQMTSWQRNVRADIWRRDASSVAMEGLPRFLVEIQYNDYQNDTLSQGNPTYAIASRGDLVTDGGAACWGAIDAKVTSYGLLEGKRQAANATSRSLAAPSLVYNGPTPQVGVFQFSTAPLAAACPPQPPLGMVDRYNFTWISVG